MRMRVRIGFALILVTYLTTIISILAGCGTPFKKNWQIHPDPGSTYMDPILSHFLNSDGD